MKSLSTRLSSELSTHTHLQSTPRGVNLSKYFPKGTEYFYSYPSGEDSHFYNGVDPATEELVAARLLVCAGEDIKLVIFPAAVQEDNLAILRAQKALSFLSRDKMVVLPETITADYRGSARNMLIKTALKRLITPGTLVMAQPYTDPELRHLYQIDPVICVWLNDKENMYEYIPSEHLPTRFAHFQDGQEFAESIATYPLPVVVKVSSSSSGDGVFICHTKGDVARAKNAFQSRKGTIFVEEYIQSVKNFGVKFGIPHVTSEPIEIIGYNEQLVSEEGSFLGGMIDSELKHPELNAIYNVLLTKILPLVRQKGWYGVGGFDVLVAEDGSFYFIDCNFRTTGMSAYIFLTKNGTIQSPMVSFSGEFTGSERDFRERVMPLTDETHPDYCMSLIALTKTNSEYRFNGALFFDTKSDLTEKAIHLGEIGVRSKALQKILSNT